MKTQVIPFRGRLFVLATVSAATLTFVLSFRTATWEEWPSLLLAFALILFASTVRLFDTRGGSVTPGTVPTYLVIYVFSPAQALFLVGVGRTIGFGLSRGWVPWRAFFNGSQAGLSAAAGSAIFRIMGGNFAELDNVWTYFAALAGPLTHQIISNFLVAYVTSTWRPAPLLRTWLVGVRELLWPNLLSVPTAFVLGVLYTRVSFALIAVYFVLLPLQGMALRLYLGRRQLYAQIVESLVVATDVNFPLGKGHARRVADLSASIAREMHLDELTIESIQFAALLHDVGMIGKDDVLGRPAVQGEDVEYLRDHVRVGAEMARELPRKEIADYILAHHEQYDGKGYPWGLRGEAIPLGARIIAVAEAFDSMSNGLYPFDDLHTPEEAVAYLESQKGQAFDPSVVEAFLAVVSRSSEERPAAAELRGSGPTLRGAPA